MGSGDMRFRLTLWGHSVLETSDWTGEKSLCDEVQSWCYPVIKRLPEKPGAKVVV